ncbi:MAG: Zn-dependent exopeptidase M28, partial [Chloroflexi bacterium]|nr:Zn-dependent exopeptidase M28 [Chloroflexota bacterium]
DPGAPMRGAIALIAGAAPGVDPIRSAQAAGAVAVIAVGGGELFKPSYIPRFEPDAIPVVFATRAAVDALLAPAGRRVDDLAAAPPFDAGFTVRVAVPLTPVRQVTTANVVGVLRGGDAEAARRAVVVGGHLDGVGTDPDGTVFRAANDNASGVAITMELARVLAQTKASLRHTVIFTGFAGEEQGLLGSAAFLDRLASTPWPAASLLAYLNLDVAGCCGERITASLEDQDLVDRVKAAAEAEAVPFTSGGRGGGSDQASFTRRRIPATMIAWTSTGPLHTTADVPAIVEQAKLDAVGRVMLRTIGSLAGRPRAA